MYYGFEIHDMCQKIVREDDRIFSDILSKYGYSLDWALENGDRVKIVEQKRLSDPFNIYITFMVDGKAVLTLRKEITVELGPHVYRYTVKYSIVDEKGEKS